MSIEDYPKFQYSIFTQGREGQYVVRAETIEELAKAKKDIEALMNDIIPPAAENVVRAKPLPPLLSYKEDYVREPVVEPAESVTCPIHGIAMKKRLKKEGGYWFDHRAKEGDNWIKCSGSGFR